MKAILLVLLSIAVPAFSNNVATGGPGIPFPWQTAEKQGFGTSYEPYRRDASAPGSRIWFTIARGIVTEVFFPRIDRAQTRDTQLLITDGKSFTHQEQFETSHEVTRVGNTPLYKIRNADLKGRYVIEKEIWADPDSDTLIQKIHIQRNIDGLQFFVLHKSAAANSLFGDTAYSHPFLMSGKDGAFGSAWQGITTDIGFEKTSVGYVGKSDGYTDLQDFSMDNTFDEAPNGNVALTGKLNIPPTRGSTDFTLFLFFHEKKDGLLKLLPSIQQLDLQKSRLSFIAGWEGYIKSLNLPIDAKQGVDPARRNLLIQSLLVLKSGEDKTYPGSVIASPSHPWGENQFESGPVAPDHNSGYHAVWPRDLYQIAGAFLAVDDYPTVVAILERLKSTQLKESSGNWSFPPRIHNKKGSFPQNFWVDGTPLYWGYQADETAMPVLLAYRLWKKGLVDLKSYFGFVKDAAEFLAEVGPWTQTDRWEENYGLSPNSAAYVISALVAASEMAVAYKQESLAAQWLALADAWATKAGDNIDSWTFTTTGKLQRNFGNGRYYLRLSGAICNKEAGGSPIFDAVWNPNLDGYFCLANASGENRFKFQSELVDAGFLALARLGVRAARYDLIQETVPVIDSLIKKDTQFGSGWYRYSFDGYGESNKGRLWPLLTGERIHYELQLLKESGQTQIAEKLDTKLKGLESFANAEGLFSEQVWDEGKYSGTPTGSATPLLWSHAEYVTLVRSLKDQKIFDEIPAVRERYGDAIGTVSIR